CLVISEHVRLFTSIFHSLCLLQSDDHLLLYSFPTRRSSDLQAEQGGDVDREDRHVGDVGERAQQGERAEDRQPADGQRHQRRHRSEEHTSELQSRENLVCRLLLEKKNKSQHLTQTSLT